MLAADKDVAQPLGNNSLMPAQPTLQRLNYLDFGCKIFKGWLPSAKLKPTLTFLVRDFAIFNTFTWQNPYQEK